MTAELGFIHEYVPPAKPGARTVLLLHGTGGDERDLLPIGQLIAPGLGYLSPRGKVLENGMPRFFRRLAEGVFDEEDLHRRTAELGEFIHNAARHYGFTPGELIALGYSNGANIAASLLLSAPQTLGGALLFRAMLPFEPTGKVDLSGKPILLSTGAADRVIPAASTARLADLLRESGADLTEKSYQAGHGLLQRELNDAREWLAGR